MNMHQKDMKIHYKKIKDRVGKIHSNLTREQIDEMKVMEQSGEVKIKLSTSTDSSIRISAAEKRLKLQPRAKSAMPRLRRSGSAFPARPLRTTHSAFTRSTSNDCPPGSPRTKSCRFGGSSINMAAISPRSNTAGTSRSCTHGRSNSLYPESELSTGSAVLPLSIRNERKKSIFIDSDDKPLKPLISITTADVDSDSGKSLTNIKVPKLTLNMSPLSGTGKSRPSSPLASPRSSIMKSPKSPKAAKKSKGMGNSKVSASSKPFPPENEKPGTQEGGLWSTRTATYLQLPSGSCVADAQNNESKDDSTPGESDRSNGAVPPTRLTSATSSGEKQRPNTAAIADSMRRKSQADMQRASRLLAEGKTTVPFDSHDYIAIEERSKSEKPFRSIRERTFNVNMETDVMSDCMGEELYRDMKRGMILGEVASSLCLEDKIDFFLDRVDDYIKVNPNYVYNAERTRAELEAVRAENKAAKAKKVKRNTLRRRQLERKLLDGEEAMREAAKARYIRLNDDELDMSNVNTLVVDQMKMLSSIKIWNQG
ncbi:hypothetical protein MAR_013654 [Mya arenaria]|uniref:Uncharacterized protein n=2 Tax=Mya arenaria TaxID=6604 RepID=A0ABY7G0L3_MYAAR|nr:hypothetical protein MAR_013654 [Mya arenaria]